MNTLETKMNEGSVRVLDGKRSYSLPPEAKVRTVRVIELVDDLNRLSFSFESDLDYLVSKCGEGTCEVLSYHCAQLEFLLNDLVKAVRASWGYDEE